MDCKIPMKPKYSLSPTEILINNILIFTSIWVEKDDTSKGHHSEGIILCVINIQKAISILIPIVKLPHTRTSLMQQFFTSEEVNTVGRIIET